jgi:hypothetical protein
MQIHQLVEAEQLGECTVGKKLNKSDTKHRNKSEQRVRREEERAAVARLSESIV